MISGCCCIYPSFQMGERVTLSIVLMCFIFLFSSCKQEKANNPDVIRITGKTVEKLSDIIANIDYVKLQDGHLYPPLAQEMIMLSHVARDNFKVYPDRFLLLNAEQTVDVYDKAGNYLFQFGKVGRGPEEYIAPGDFCYNPYSGHYAVASRSAVFFYDTEGNFIKRRAYRGGTYPSFTKKIEAVSATCYMIAGLIMEEREFALFFSVDTAGYMEQQPYYSPRDNMGSQTIPSGRFVFSGNQMLFLYHDSLFITQNNRPVLYSSFDFPNVHSFGIRLYRENEEWRMFHVSRERVPAHFDEIFVLQSGNGTLTHFISDETEDDCFLGIGKGAYGFVLDAWDIVEGRIVVTLTATDFKEMVDKAVQNPQNYPYYEKARKIAEGLNEESNNIIAWVTLKS